jgi:NAD(P)H-dependent flavin oxidoreductase YrpB (nitropropane dioxygenase family)
MLLSLCAEQLKIPYLASGGFANGRQVAAALALGAVKATEMDTVLCLRKFRNTSRLHKNTVSVEVVKIEAEKKDVKFEDVAHLMSGKRGAQVYETGDVNAGVWSLGMCAGLIHDIPTCEELAKTLERDAIEALSRSNGLIVDSAKL